MKKMMEKFIQKTPLLIPMLINLITVINMRYPIITDEYITLLEGSFLDGGVQLASSVQTLPATGYYGWGYAILVGWIYNITNDMQIVYYAALICNSILLGMIPIFAYNISVKYFSIKKNRAVSIALCIGIYPAYMVYAKYALNETMLFFIIWIVLLLFLKFLHTSSKISLSILSVVIGCVATYAYTVHGRGLAILGVVIILYIFLNAVSDNKLKWKILNFCLFLISILFIIKVNSYFKIYISECLLGVEPESLANTTNSFLNTEFFHMLFSPNGAKIFYGLLGQIFYIVIATFGVAVVAVCIYPGLIVKELKNKKVSDLGLLGTLSLGFLFSTLCISTLFFANLYITEAMPRGEYYIYGRYNELSCAMVIFFILLYIEKVNEKQKKIFILSGLLSVILLIGGVLIGIYKILRLPNPSLSYTMVPSLIPFCGKDIYTNPEVISYIKLGVILIFLSLLINALIYFRRCSGVMLCLGALFFYSALYSLITFVYPTSSQKYEDIVSIKEWSSNLASLADERYNMYVIDLKVPKPRAIMAFKDYDVKYLNFDMEGYYSFELISKNSFIISNYDENLDNIFDEIYYVKKINDIYIWCYGDDLRRKLEDAGDFPYKRTNENLVFLPDDLSSSLNIANQMKNNNNEILLENHDIQYGPYCILKEGRYKIYINGENLKDCVVNATYNSGKNTYKVDNLVKNNINISYEIKVNELNKDVEFILTNMSDQKAKIYSIIVVALDNKKLLSIKDAGSKKIYEKVYDVENLYGNFRSQILIDKNAIASSTAYVINKNGQISISNLTLCKGENDIAFLGEYLENIIVNIYTLDGNLIEWVEYNNSDNPIGKVKLNKDTEIIIKITNPNDKPAYFQTLKIRNKDGT